MENSYSFIGFRTDSVEILFHRMVFLLLLLLVLSFEICLDCLLMFGRIIYGLLMSRSLLF